MMRFGMICWQPEKWKIWQSLPVLQQDIWSNNIGFSWPGKDPSTLPLFGTVAMTYDFGKTIHWQIKEGRDFSRSFLTDSRR